MQKKLIAVAVAGALAAPAAVLAQSTVQLYGAMYMEYGFLKQGPTAAGANDPANPDVFQAPGSAVGFKGEEKLGGGMSAWFQCESSADIRGVNQDGFCSRNSAMGLKGSFGNVFAGNWDTPFKRARVGNMGANDTGAFGNGHLLYGASTSTTDGASPGVHSRRQRNSINYETPKFGGFQGMFSRSSNNAATNDLATAQTAKSRTMSMAGVYTAGPMVIGLGYNQNKDAYTTATFAGDESAWHINAAYTLGKVKLGGAIVKSKSDTAVATNATNSSWHLGAEWNIAGPHNLHFGYTNVGDMKGTAGAAMGTRPVVAANSGAKLIQVKYQHALSKRTYAGVGYTQLKNDTNGNYNLGGLSLQRDGSKHSGIVFNVGHKF